MQVKDTKEYGKTLTAAQGRLYLPKDWCDDSQRCNEAGIPEEERGFRTKIDLAYEIILHQLDLGTSFDYIGADGFYGNDCNLARKIDQLGKVSEYIKGLDREQWEDIKVRKTAKGTLRGLYHFAEVYICNKLENQIEKRLLVIRRMKTKSGEEIKYSFTNADLVQYTPKALAYIQAQRFFIEHCIKEAKYILGMDQFQTRKWLAWYHQVALNIMTMCFMLKEKLFCFKDLPLLSARDICYLKEYANVST